MRLTNGKSHTKTPDGINYPSHSGLWLDVSITMIDCARGIVSEIRSGIKTIAVDDCVRACMHTQYVTTNGLAIERDFFANTQLWFKRLFSLSIF